jgi:hypothetical protein
MRDFIIACHDFPLFEGNGLSELVNQVILFGILLLKPSDLRFQLLHSQLVDLLYIFQFLNKSKHTESECFDDLSSSSWALASFSLTF